MEIRAEKEPRLQVEDGEPLAIGSATVDWVDDRSYLRDLTGADGRPLELPVGSKVTLYTGPSVVFVGRVQDDQSVLDLLSCEGVDDGEYVDF